MPLEVIGGLTFGEATDRAAVVDGEELLLERVTRPIGVHDVELNVDSVVWKSRPQPMRGAIIR